jgi:bla regulator protein blaR1
MRHRAFIAAAAAAIVVPVILSSRSAAPLAAQEASPAFEVASVKPNKSGDGRIMLGVQPGGRFNATGATLKMLIGMAYGAGQPLANFQIIGGPDWIDGSRFDIVAKAPPDTVLGPGSALPLMIRALLADRFKLVVHTETREQPIYALVMARSDGRRGPDLTPAEDCSPRRGGRGAPPPGPPPPPPAPLAPGERPVCGMRIGFGSLSGGGMPIANLANALSRLPAVNRVVQDRTGLTGAFNFDLKWTPDQLPPLAAGGPPGGPPLPAIDPNGPSLFAAVQEQLGLKLESVRGPVEVVVIDRAEQPTED